MSHCNIDTINYLLFSYIEILTGGWESNTKCGFFVHSSVLPSIRKFLKLYGIQYLWDIWDYELKIGEQLYDMKLIFLKRKSDELFKIISILIEISQFTFYWNRSPTLYSTLDQFDELKEFISLNNLTDSVVSEHEQLGVNSKGQPIKVVTFNRKIDYITLIIRFQQFLISKASHQPNRIPHYYITIAFPWLQPNRLQHFKKPLKNKRVFLELQTFLLCMRELSYNCEPYLDFMGLCSLKLAFCDNRYMVADTKELEFEIENLIERSLKRMERTMNYIKNDEFNLHQYTLDLDPPFLLDLPIYYFSYRFQNNFKFIKLSSIAQVVNFKSNFTKNSDSLSISLETVVQLKQSIKLVKEVNVLKKIKDMSNSRLIIDGSQFAEMNHKLFCDIIECCNIESIILDTDYKWLNTDMDSHRGNAENSIVQIYLTGENKYNFIERFVSSLAKIIKLHNIQLFIYTKLKDYRIFNDLIVNVISLPEINLTTKMLIELHDCYFKRTRLAFTRCRIENSVTTWELLNELKFAYAVIIEEETTWQFIFEYIADHLTKLKLAEFQFKIDISIEYRDRNNNEALITLNHFKFTIDEYKSRVEIRNLIDGEIMDLYLLKNPRPINQNDGDNFLEFYK